MFVTYIVWGSPSTVANNPIPVGYSFETQAELDAFLEGVDAGCGYLDYANFETLADAKQHVTDLLDEEGYDDEEEVETV